MGMPLAHGQTRIDVQNSLAKPRYYGCTRADAEEAACGRSDMHSPWHRGILVECVPDVCDNGGNRGVQRSASSATKDKWQRERSTYYPCM